ncbi:MAG: hypothetical protein JWN46_2792 [Acidimicrobiales bacterium]|nr:hypothetical protein [Acidimicrobiales bacterium]
MTVMAIPRFERFFRAAAGLDVDKDDLERYSDFVNTKLYDLLLLGEVAASENGRDVQHLHDLPITKGLQESMHAFRRLDEDVDLQPILDQLAIRPQLDRPLDEEATAQLPTIVGAISYALARTFTILDPDLKNPQAEHWERAFQVFDQLL